MLVCLLCSSDNDQGLFYTGQDLEYVYVVHSLSLLGRLLLYEDGRALFPVELPDREGTPWYRTFSCGVWFR